MYVNNSGLEGYWTYHSQDVGRAGTGHVNDYTGNLVFIHNDLSMNGNRMPVTINHVYNSNDKDITIGYGYGWRLNLTQTVKWESIGGVDYFTHTDEDGTKHYYKYDSEKGYYVDDAGTDFSLTISGSGSSTIHTIKDKGGNKLNFDYNGYLKTIEDKNGNKIILTYDANDKLIKVEDGAGRATILNYNEWGYLLDITDPAGRRTDYRYTGAQLTTITYTYDGSKVTTYTYDGTNNLTSAINYDGYKMNYLYYDILTSGGAQSYRVKKVQETHTNGILGQEINISYGKNTTTFIDHMGERNIYQFNYLGNTVSSKDADNNGSYYKYYTPEERKNMLELDSKLQKTVINLLKNHNMEISGSNWAVGGLGGSTGSGSFTTADKYIGNQSLKIIKTNNADRHYFSQSVTLEKGKTYTLSGYVKTNNVSNTNGKGAVLYVTYQSASGEWLYHDSNYISGTNDWQRIEVTFTLPSDVPSVTVYVGAGIYGETGEAYFDNLQLEEGFIANRYNLIENSSLEGGTNVPLFWNRNPNLTADDTVSISEKIFGSQSFKINGESGWLKSIYQVVKVSGKKDDTIVASGWAKADSVPLSSNRNFAIYLGVTDPDGNTLQNEILKFNPDTTDWQYMTNIIKTKGDYVSITIYLIYYDNDNSVYFDGIQMYKEEFGQSYQYDANGNLKSITDLAKQTSTFEYNGDNDLIKAIDPKGGNFTYEYSADGRRNITKATSAENVVYSFDYDDYGNPKTARVGESTLFMESSARYTLSGNYLKSLTDGQGNSIINHYDEAKGVLNSVTDANGNKIIYNYDAMNRLTGVSKILGTKNIEKFPLNINTTGNKGTNPIEENAVFDKDADGYSTFAAFEGTANLLSNSSFEGSTTGWTLQDWDNSTGKWRLSTDSAVGNNSIECYDSDGLMNGSGTNCVAYQTVDLSAPLTVQKQYTLSVYAKRIGANKPELGILCYDASGAEIPEGYQNYAMTITENQWIRVSHIFMIPAGTKSFRTLIRSHVKDNEVVRFDGVQLEEKPIATPYTAGVRPSSKAYYDLGIDKRSGTMSIWFKTIGSGERMIFGNEGSNGEIFNVYINLQNQIILNRRDNQGNTLNIITVNDMTIAANQWYFVALKWQWNNNTLSCTLYINDSVYTGDVSDFKDFTGGITAIGSSIFSAYLLNGYLEQFTYTPNALSDADINLLYAKTMGDDTGTVVSSSYTYENDRIKTVAHNGFGYSFDYDFLGNNTEVYVGSQRLIKNTYEIDTVDEKGINTSNLLESEYGNGQKVGYQYDSLDRITARTYDGDVKYKYKYDGSGNLGYYEDLANGQKYRYSYDMADRLTKIVDNEGNYARLYYDKNNNPSKVTQRLENIIYETAYGHDKDNRLTEILYGGTASDNTKAEYFPLNGGTVGSKGTQPIEQTPVFENDENGQEVLSAYAGTKVIYDLSINKAAGSMSVWMNTKDTGVRQILANEGTNKEILNLYIDNDNKVNLAIRNSADVFINLITTSETINTNEWYFVALKWQFSGNILTCALYLNSKTYTASAEDFKDFSGGKAAVGTSIFGEYPLKGWVKRFSYSPYYLSENEILAMYYNVRVNYNYDTLGRMNRKTINTGLFSFATEYSYVPGTAVNSTTAKVASIKNNDGAPITYQYDANGNISRMTMQDGITIDYVYDELNELIREDNKVLNKTIIYSYDVGGNILTKTEYQYTAPGATPTVQIGNPVTYSYEDSNWKDKLTNYNGKDIGYDAIGNTTSYDGYTYEWEAGRQLKTITGNNKNISYKYNDAGIRIEKKVNGVTTKYYLLGSKVAYEADGTGKIYYAYDDGKSLVSMNLNGVEYYYIRNAQGDITGLFDKNRTQVVSYTYDTWGKLISIKDQNGIDVTDDTTHVGYKNPYRYRGYRYDSETGLYYLNSRYYNPELGRYINADRTLSGANDTLGKNLFAYCNSNPINFSDPDGKLLTLLGAAIISGVIGAAISAGTTAFMGAVTGTFNWTDVGIAAATGFLAGALMPVVGTTQFGATVLNVGSSMSQYIWSKKAYKQPIKKSELAVAAGVALVLGGRSSRYIKLSSGFNPPTYYISNAGLPVARQPGLVQMERYEVLIDAIAQSATRRNIINGIISNGGIDLAKNVINYISERISIFKNPEDDYQK